MLRRSPISPRLVTLFPYTTLFRSDDGHERLRVDVRDVDGQGVAAAHGDGALDAGSSEVLLGRLPRCGGVERDVAAFDGRYGLDLLPARARGLGSDVVSPLLFVDLATEIDREAAENHHRQARGDQNRKSVGAGTEGAGSGHPGCRRLKKKKT